MAKPTKRKVQGGRSGKGPTPKGGRAGAAKAAASGRTTDGSAVKAKAAATAASAPDSASSSYETGRYTAPLAHHGLEESPRWVPILMFGLLIVGVLIIMVNYTGVLWDTSNWFLIGGLAAILGGIITATQLR